MIIFIIICLIILRPYAAFFSKPIECILFKIILIKVFCFKSWNRARFKSGKIPVLAVGSLKAAKFFSAAAGNLYKIIHHPFRILLLILINISDIIQSRTVILRTFVFNPAHRVQRGRPKLSPLGQWLIERKSNHLCTCSCAFLHRIIAYIGEIFWILANLFFCGFAVFILIVQCPPQFERALIIVIFIPDRIKIIRFLLLSEIICPLDA